MVFEMLLRFHCSLITVRMLRGLKWVQCGDCPSKFGFRLNSNSFRKVKYVMETRDKDFFSFQPHGLRLEWLTPDK